MVNASNEAPEKYQLHFSERGIPLVDCSGTRTRPVITVENYCKWYSLYLIHVDGRVEGIDPDILDEINAKDRVAIRGDHNYHPRLLYRLADRLNARICPQSLEIVTARWLLEIEDNKYAVDLGFRPPKK